MKHTLSIFFLCFWGYTIYAQKDNLTINAFYPQIPASFEWSEGDIIAILETGNVLFCKLDYLFERNDTSFYIKNMEIIITNHPVFESAYLESSVCYSKRFRHHKQIQCVYFIINDKFGSQIELTENELRTLPWIEKYLDRKIQKTHMKEYKESVFLE